MNGNLIAYWLIRALLAFGGFTAIMSTVSCHFVMPTLCYDHLPEPPPLPERLPDIVLGFAIGGLMLLPNRLTLEPWWFWPRFVVSIGIGLFFGYLSVTAIVAGLAGGRDPMIFLAAAGFLFVGIAIPGSLWWRRQIAKSRHAP